MACGPSIGCRGTREWAGRPALLLHVYWSCPPEEAGQEPRGLAHRRFAHAGNGGDMMHPPRRAAREAANAGKSVSAAYGHVAKRIAARASAS
jgi:hypothetical protein